VNLREHKSTPSLEVNYILIPLFIRLYIIIFIYQLGQMFMNIVVF